MAVAMAAMPVMAVVPVMTMVPVVAMMVTMVPVMAVVRMMAMAMVPMVSVAAVVARMPGVVMVDRPPMIVSPSRPGPRPLVPAVVPMPAVPPRPPVIPSAGISQLHGVVAAGGEIGILHRRVILGLAGVGGQELGQAHAAVLVGVHPHEELLRPRLVRDPRGGEELLQGQVAIVVLVEPLEDFFRSGVVRPRWGTTIGPACGASGGDVLGGSAQVAAGMENSSTVVRQNCSFDMVSLLWRPKGKIPFRGCRASGTPGSRIPWPSKS